MKVLIIGSGGREHALAWKISQSKKVTKLYCAPSNAGIDNIAKRVNINVEDIEELASFAMSNSIDLTVVGPEVPLSLGIADEFKENNLLIFGPDKISAQVESSKCFAKEIMNKYNIPTASYRSFDTLSQSINYIDSQSYPLVVKYDGLAAGKGVSICQNKTQAIRALQAIFKNENTKAIIEEYLTGKEVSILAICDGIKAVCMLPAQDYKTAFENNEGPNTGGMGSYAPSVFVTSEHLKFIQTDIIDKTLAGLKNEGITYTGVLYAGLMISEDNDIKVLEFNCRFGDPETQAILPLLQDDLFDILYQSAQNDLKYDKFTFTKEYCTSITLASEGYPGIYKKGEIIRIDNEHTTSNSTIFIAGAENNNFNELITSGGRVSNITAWDKSLNESCLNAYRLVNNFNFEGKQYRKDITRDAITHLKDLSTV